jgi:hypothetical protein
LIQLVTPEGAVIADTATVLKLTADATAGASNIKTEPESAQVWHQPIQESERTGVDERLANPDAARVAPEDPVPLQTRRPVQTAKASNFG